MLTGRRVTRLVITGASGFIGRHLLVQALAAGHQVLCLGRSRPALSLPSSALHHPCDLWQAASYHKALAAFRPEAAIHLAWYAEPGKYLHAAQNVDALSGSLRLVQALIAAGCPSFVAAGTCAEYQQQPGICRTDSPTAPSTVYAASKLAFHLTASQLCAQAGASWAWGRVFYLYGPGEDRRRAIPALIASLLAGTPFPATDGTQIRDYLQVGDVASGFLTLAEQRAVGVFNLCSGEPCTVRSLFHRTAAVLGRQDLVCYGQRKANDWDPPIVCGDPAALRALGWQPRFTLATGLADTVDWWRSRVAP